MKKLTFILIALLCYISSSFATRYLVQLGTGGAVTWRTSGASETLVDLTVATKTLNAWFNTQVFNAEDVVWLAAGTYVLDGTINVPTKIKFSLCGGFTGSETTVDARVKGTNEWDFANETVLDGNSHQIFVATGADYYDGDAGRKSLFDGFTMTNGSATNGGAFIGNAAITLQNCKLTNNTATAAGGAVYITGGQFVSVTKCLFDSNISSTGGGGAVVEGDRVEVSYCIFQFNRVNTGIDSRGGGLRFQGGSNAGGGEYGRIDNSIFRGNYSNGYGGGFSINGNASIAKNCLIVNNQGNQEYGSYNSIFYSGGKIVNSTVANNQGGIRVDGGVSGEIINTIFWNNGNKTFENASSNSLVFTNCASDKTIDSPWTAAGVVTLGSANSDGAKFKLPTTFISTATNEIQKAEILAADWRLDSGSPCINTGTATNAPSIDLSGTLRPIGGGFDIGAFEEDLGTGMEQSFVNFRIVVINANEVQISGLQKGDKICICRIDGKLVYNSLSESQDVKTNLPQGVYIVKINNQSHKLIVR